MRVVNETVKPARLGDGRKDRWSAHREQRQREFVDAALRVLEAHGPDLPMDAVAAEAGVTKPVLYRYFSDKAALLRAIDKRGSEILLDRLLPAINGSSPALARIREAVGAFFAFIDEHPNLYWLARRANTEVLGGGPIQRNKEFISTVLTAVIGDCLRAFGLDSGAAEPWAYGLTGLVQSTGEWWLQRRSMSRAHVVGYTTDLIWQALSGVAREAGITLHADRPLPTARPPLALHRSDRAPGNAAG